MERFYDRFMASSPEVRNKFRGTDLTTQYRVLRRSLELCPAAAAGDQASLGELTTRARTHDRAHLDIRPALYDLWRQALLATAADSDPEWDEETEDVWREALEFALGLMKTHY